MFWQWVEGTSRWHGCSRGLSCAGNVLGSEWRGRVVDMVNQEDCQGVELFLDVQSSSCSLLVYICFFCWEWCWLDSNLSSSLGRLTLSLGLEQKEMAQGDLVGSWWRYFVGFGVGLDWSELSWFHWLLRSIIRNLEGIYSCFCLLDWVDWKNNNHLCGHRKGVLSHFFLSLLEDCLLN